MTPEILNYLQKIDGGDWSSKEMKQELCNLVVKCSKEFKDSELLSVQLGVFAGATLFPIAMAHKSVNNGSVCGIDTWEFSASLDGKNHSDVDAFWRGMDFTKTYSDFIRRSEMDEWSGKITHFKGNTKQAYRNFADESITLLHQDSAHNTETIIEEIKVWSPKIKKGGYWVISAANWGEAVDGYLQLPKFGFKLVQDYDGWEVWQKDDSATVKTTTVVDDFNSSVLSEFTKLKPQISNTVNLGVKNPNDAVFIDLPIIDKGGHKSMIQYKIDNSPKEYRKDGGMQVGGMHLKPILLYLPDTKEWVEKYQLAQKHLGEQGFENIYELAGVHAKEFGIKGDHIFLLDNRPEEKHYVGDGNVGNYISQYVAYIVMDALDYSHYWYLESDARMVEGWREKLEQALLDAGDDWDIMFVGSCCTQGKNPIHIKGDVWEFPNRGKKFWNLYPLCTHSYIINKRCIKHMIATNRDVANNTDISMQYNSFPKMRVLAILPILSYQHNNDIFKEFNEIK